MIQLDNYHGDRQKKKRYAGCLVHAVTGMFYSIVANQRRPQQYTYHVLQRRCQPRPTIFSLLKKQCKNASWLGKDEQGRGWITMAFFTSGGQTRYAAVAIVAYETCSELSLTERVLSCSKQYCIHSDPK